jgi:hypothetical protein
MLAHSRKLTVFTAASYLLAITGSSLLHDHSGHGEAQPRPGVSAAHSADGHDCSVCQFLAQKPAPVAPVAPATSGVLVEEVAAPAPVCVAWGVLTAWHSRAPPLPA